MVQFKRPENHASTTFCSQSMKEERYLKRGDLVEVVVVDDLQATFGLHAVEHGSQLVDDVVTQVAVFNTQRLDLGLGHLSHTLKSCYLDKLKPDLYIKYTN